MKPEKVRFTTQPPTRNQNSKPGNKEPAATDLRTLQGPGELGSNTETLALPSLPFVKVAYSYSKSRFRSPFCTTIMSTPHSKVVQEPNLESRWWGSGQERWRLLPRQISPAWTRQRNLLSSGHMGTS